MVFTEGGKKKKKKKKKLDPLTTRISDDARIPSSEIIIIIERHTSTLVVGDVDEN